MIALHSSGRGQFPVAFYTRGSIDFRRPGAISQSKGRAAFLHCDEHRRGMLCRQRQTMRTSQRQNQLIIGLSCVFIFSKGFYTHSKIAFFKAVML
jgi:hypothetical protein